MNPKVIIRPPSAAVRIRSQVVKEYVDVEPYEGSYEVTPSGSEQVLQTEDKRLTNDLTVKAIPGDYVGADIPRDPTITRNENVVTVPEGYYTDDTTETIPLGSAAVPAAAITATPEISVSSGGLITASVDAEQSVSPEISEGYVKNGTPGTVRAAGSATLQLSVQAGKTVTPTESKQTAVGSKKYTTGYVYVGGIPKDYVGSEVPRRSSSDLTKNGATVEAPAGYYAEPASKAVDAATWDDGDTITENPAISIDGDGLITAAYEKTQQTQPISSSGFAQASQSYPVKAKGSATLQLPKRTSADLSVSGDTVQAPAGYYPSAASKAVPAGSASVPQTTIVTEPALLLDPSTGIVSASVSASESVSPLIVPGYVSAGNAGSVQVSGSKSLQLPTKAAQIYVPNKTSQQIIQAGQFLLGDQTVDKIPDQYYDMSGDMSWLGADATLIKTLTEKNWKLSETGFNTWTPSSTAATVLPSVTLSDDKFTAEDLENYSYIILWTMQMAIKYTEGSSPTQKALPLYSVGQLAQEIFRRQGSWSGILDGTMNYNISAQRNIKSFLRYYGSTSGSVTYTWAASYGFYYTQSAPTVSSTSILSPTITPKTPTMSARCSTTYMSTANAALIDKEATKLKISGKVYRIHAESYMHGFYRKQGEAIAAIAE